MAKKKDADQHESAEHTASPEKATTPEQANHVVFDPFAIPDLPLGDLLRTDDLVKQESDSEESE